MAITRQDYQRLRHAANERIRRLEKAGFTAPERPQSSRGMSDSDIRNAYKQLEKWMNKEASTVTGAKAKAAREAERAAARRERQRERYAERRRLETGEQGRPYQPRPPKLSEEQKRERRNQYQRNYRAKLKSERETLNKQLDDITLANPKLGMRLKNLLKGLDKYSKQFGSKVRTLEELMKWKRYIDERNRDKEKGFYEFDIWLEEVQTKVGKENKRVTGADLDNLLEDFTRWESDMDELEREFIRERMPYEYTQDKLGTLWSAYMHKK